MCGVKETQCTHCNHLQVCSFKAQFLAAQKAVDEVRFDTGDRSFVNLRDISWIRPVSLECSYFSGKVPTTPTDIDFSLERYNLIRRAYWVNGQREKAAAVVCQVEKPLGYIILFTESGSVVGRFVVDGKVSSLNSFLTPDSTYVESGRYLPDVDGSYGENDCGIFFFTPDGKYVEWTGTYLYSDIPFEVDDPVVKVGG